MSKFIDIKRKNLSLFQSNSIQLQSVVSLITSWKDTIQAIPSKKKRGKRRERMKRRRRKGKRCKKGEEEKGMERVCAEGKAKGANEMWKRR